MPWKDRGNEQGGLCGNRLERHFDQAELRARAVKRLTGTNGSHDPWLKPSAAFQVLHDLASSPSTAAAAMALLHELQAHQVEVDSSG